MAGIDDYVSNIVLKVVRRLLLTGGLAISVAGALPSSIAPNPVKVRAVHTRADVVAVDTLCRLVGLKGDDQVFEEVMPCAEVARVRRQAGVRYSSKQLEYATLDYTDFDGLAHTAKVATFVLDGQAKAGSSIVVAYDADRPDVVVPTSAKPGILSWLAPVGLIVGPVLLAIWWFLRDGLPAGVPRRPKQGGAALTDDVEMGLPVRNAETERTILVLGKRTAGERPLTTVRPLVVAPAQVWASKEKAAESVRVTRVVPAGPQAAAERMARVVKRVGETGAQLPAMVVVEGQSQEVAEGAAAVAEGQSQEVVTIAETAVEGQAPEVAEVTAVAVEGQSPVVATNAATAETAALDQAPVIPEVTVMTVQDEAEAIELSALPAAELSGVVTAAGEWEALNTELLLARSAEIGADPQGQTPDEADLREVAAPVTQVETVDVADVTPVAAQDQNPNGSGVPALVGQVTKQRTRIGAVFGKLFQFARFSTRKSVNGEAHAQV